MTSRQCFLMEKLVLQVSGRNTCENAYKITSKSKFSTHFLQIPYHLHPARQGAHPALSNSLIKALIFLCEMKVSILRRILIVEHAYLNFGYWKRLHRFQQHLRHELGWIPTRPAPKCCENQIMYPCRWNIRIKADCNLRQGARALKGP